MLKVSFGSVLEGERSGGGREGRGEERRRLQYGLANHNLHRVNTL